MKKKSNSRLLLIIQSGNDHLEVVDCSNFYIPKWHPMFQGRLDQFGYLLISLERVCYGDIIAGMNTLMTLSRSDKAAKGLGNLRIYLK
jgi:hypothetical protein